MSEARKVFFGPRIRRLREQRQWSQAVLAERLGLSLSYVSQIENNQRPVTASVLLKLAETFGGDVGQFSQEPDRRLLGELDCALHDRTLRAEPVSPAGLMRFIDQAPELVETFLSLYERHTRLQEEHALLVDRFYGDQGAGSRSEAAVPLPHEEVRDHFNRRNNYLDALDREAEALAGRLELAAGYRAAALQDLLQQQLGVQVSLVEDDTLWLRRFDAHKRLLRLSSRLTDAQRAFQMATQFALLAHAELIDAEIGAAGFIEPAARSLAQQGLAHYFAGALILPYGDFLEYVRAVRYDIELLQERFQVGFETVCHRLSTLQRPGDRGVPFYFVRIDQAGNISKRQSATAFHFARHGGACPLWQVHEAFAQPGRILTQGAEMPDGTRFFGLARTIERGSGGFRARRKQFAVGLGCELSHARALVYADEIDVDKPRDVTPIGPGCRVCPRDNCVQRAFPPAGKPLVADRDSESLMSYRFSDS
ncbi:MAG TPA: short-chain fatty acyl-CoA regulator family protein [Burkholderiaceae bacterium]|nr:short-chain fatty acyl-CoA regulator family protein [Burkholderiaceae bacterium]